MVLYIPTFVTGSLTALTIFASFHSSEKSGLSGPEKNHFDAICFLCKTILSLLFSYGSIINSRRILNAPMDSKVLSKVSIRPSQAFK